MVVLGTSGNAIGEPYRFEQQTSNPGDHSDSDSQTSNVSDWVMNRHGNPGVEGAPPSPAPSDSSSTHSRDTGSRSPHPQGMVNGHSGSYSSFREAEHSNDDAPLDFSLKKYYQEEEKENEREQSHVTEIKQEQDDGHKHTNGFMFNPLIAKHIKTENGLSQEGKIGEPKLSIPGPFPGGMLPGGAGMLPSFPPGFLPNPAMFGAFPFLAAQMEADHSKLNGATTQNGTKPVPKELLQSVAAGYGLPTVFPGLTPPPVDPSLPQEEVVKQYKLYLSKLSQLQQQQHPPTPPARGAQKRKAPSSTIERHPVPLPTPSTGGATLVSTSMTSPIMSTSPHSINGDCGSPGSSRKRGRILPDEQKDEAYWERRRKNNEAAKRSRDARRAKEEEIAMRAAFLEQENLRLRVEVAALKTETAKLRCMLYNS